MNDFYEVNARPIWDGTRWIEPEEGDGDVSDNPETVANNATNETGHAYKPIGTGYCWTCGESFHKHKEFRS